MPRPEVSVVVPAYNAARFLSASLNSILAQTHPPLEVLVMDDASTDDTARIAASYAPPVRHVRQSINKGIYENVNDGIRMARGEFIATYHADDIYTATMIERQLQAFERFPEVGAVFCLDILVDEDDVEYSRLRLPSGIRADEPLDRAAVLNGLLRYKNPFLVCPTAMVRASVHHQVGVYNQQLWRNSSDLDMWLRIAERHRLLIVGDHLMRYRHSSEQSSRRYHRLRTEPNRFFRIMDHHLARGMRAFATPAALQAYEAHRAEDALIVAVNRYVLGDAEAARAGVRSVAVGALVGSRVIQWGRLTILYGLLRAACVLPWSRLLATLFAWRWHTRSRPGKPGESLMAALHQHRRGRDPRVFGRAR